MNRTAGTVVLLLALCVFLPEIARAAQAAVPALGALLVFVCALHFVAAPPSRSRRTRP